MSATIPSTMNQSLGTLPKLGILPYTQTIIINHVKKASYTKHMPTKPYLFDLGSKIIKIGFLCYMDHNILEYHFTNVQKSTFKTHTNAIIELFSDPLKKIFSVDKKVLKK